MNFSSKQIPGKGRGKTLGFPTINLEIPQDLNINHGIYAVKVIIGGKNYLGAMHYGPIPTFNEQTPSLEIFLIDANNFELSEGGSLLVDQIKFIRPILLFKSEKELTAQIEKDVLEVKKIFS